MGDETGTYLRIYYGFEGAAPQYVRENVGRRFESQSFSPRVLEKLSKTASGGLLALVPALKNLFKAYAEFRSKNLATRQNFRTFCMSYDPIDGCMTTPEPDDRRRRCRRLFPGRDPPVLTRLLQEIREANEKFNASQ